MVAIDPTRLLINKNPSLAEQWHPAKNDDLLLETVYAGSSKKVWWQCEAGHEWEYAINHRVAGSGDCVLCNKKVLLTANPELAEEWGTRNVTAASAHKPGSRERVWWICPEGHEEYLAAIANRRLLGVKCPQCRVPPFQKSVAGVTPQLVEEWSNKNNVSALATFARSSSKAYWECKTCSHEWATRVSYRVNNDKGCPKCNQRAISDTNLAVRFPAIAEEYSDKNKLRAEEIAAGSRKLCFWNCPNGHEYKMRPFERTKEMSGCPLCRLEAGSLAARYPLVAREFDIEKNDGKTAHDYMAGSSARVFWKCVEAGHEWNVGISSRTGKKITGCPECIRSGTSNIEESIRDDLKRDGIITDLQDHQVSLELQWRNRKTLRVDILGKYKGSPVVIEYDGWYWHTGQKKKDSVTPLQRDLAKTEALLDKGYVVIRIREEHNLTTRLSFLEISHPNLFQLHWNPQSFQNDTSTLRKEIYGWLNLRFNK